MREILEDLFEQGYEEAIEYAKTLVTVPLLVESRAYDLAKEAAIALIVLTPDAGWGTVWPAIANNKQFGRQVLEGVAGDFRERRTGTLARRLTEDQAADLYIWLTEQFPHSEDPQFYEGHFVGAREKVSRFRDVILDTLKHRGTPGSLVVIKRIMDRFPELEWLRYTLVGAKEQVVRTTWIPPSPNELIELCSHPTSRLVRNSQELQDVILDILQEINRELQGAKGETPAVHDLWNLPISSRDQSTVIQPKGENHFSDWLKRCLNDKVVSRGILGMREVEIRPGIGRDSSRVPGERTDLYVVATTPGIPDGSYEVARVIIEIKGCWHEDVQAAMKTQLVERYLKDNDCCHGVYIVGWYLCPQWDDSDRRKNAVPWNSLEIAEDYLREQELRCTDGINQVCSVVLNATLGPSSI